MARTRRWGVKNIKAIDTQLKNQLRDKEFRRGFGAVKSVTRASLSKEVAKWGRNRGMSPSILEQLALDVKGAGEFRKGLKAIVGFVVTRLRLHDPQKKYALVALPKLMRNAEKKRKTSQHWMLGPLMDGLRKRGAPPPVAIVEDQKGVRFALEHGVDAFIYVDDAFYSGMQALEDSKELFDHVVSHFRAHRSTPPRQVTLAVAAVFASDAAVNKLELNFKRWQQRAAAYYNVPKMKSLVYAPFSMAPEVDKELVVDRTKTYRFKPYRGRTILSHKAPDAQSFFNGNLSSLLAKKIKKPY